MEISEKDPVETNITIDYDRKVLMCYTTHKPTINQWMKDFPQYTRVSKDKQSATANNIPLDSVRKIKLYKPKNYSEESLEKLRSRMSQNRAKIAS